MAGPIDRDSMLLEAGLTLTSELSLEAVLQRIVELAIEVTGSRYGALGILGPDGRIRRFIPVGMTNEQQTAIGRFPVGRGILGSLIVEARPMRIPDIQADPRSVGFPKNHPPMRSFLGAPVKARGKVFGNIYLTEKQGSAEFDTEDERALVVLAAHAGVAVENARLYQEAERRARWLNGLREVTSAILAGAGADSALRVVVQRARELVEAETATLVAPADDVGTLEIRAADGAHALDLEGMRSSVTESVSGQVMATARPVVLEDASSDDRSTSPSFASASSVLQRSCR